MPMLAASEIYFPEPEEIEPFALAFAGLMIAHAKFEAEVRSLQGVIAGDENFGEQPCNQWPAYERRKRMAKLIKSKLGNIDEAKLIGKLLNEAKQPSDDRNMLAHGHWWCVNHDTMTLKVRRGKYQEGKPMHVDWTVASIDRATETFKDLEAELFRVRREVERNWIEGEFPPPPD